MANKKISELTTGTPAANDWVPYVDIAGNETKKTIRSSLQGYQGPQGVQGVQGCQGTQGIQGYQGVQGTQGAQGFQGPQGISAGLQYVVSANLRNSNDAEKSDRAATYTKVKETLLNTALPSVRIKFDMKGETADGTTYYAKIYKSGVTAGTEQSVTAATYATKSEDFNNFGAGDYIQVYVKGSTDTSGHQTYIQNLRLYYDQRVLTMNGLTLTTPLDLSDVATASTTNIL